MKIEMEPLSMTEAKKIVETANEEEKEENGEIKAFLKKFSKINAEKAEKIRKELESMDILNLKKEHIAKIIDLLPEDVIDVNKIFTDTNLDENETNKVLEIVKKYS